MTSDDMGPWSQEPTKLSPTPPKTAAPHKAAAKISMLRVRNASMESTLGQAQGGNVSITRHEMVLVSLDLCTCTRLVI
jgi:hypothetical protein